ncbi:hypothetical protein [Usitatibacter palustris]|uniref:MetA-pathway of phenol degradation n=1 Tax=Usitatibacter palustris TaxID=2732487 RepID=A0A6M4H7E2_9PROT|nr:hypothetical protein [Usitatibacter palustris]QJR14818.1 hypothetical protein DSM104440_01628 [Usitatibacter palustris]
MRNTFGLVLLCALGQSAIAQDEPRTLPFLGEEARKRGYELPEPFGVGLVYYKLNRDIEVSDVRVGRNGTVPSSVSQYADLGSTSDVDNINVKVDVWLLPFLNVYGIVGKIWNKSDTNIDVTLPPLLPNGPTRRFQTTVPTSIEGTVKGLGVTLAGGYKSFFGALDVNWAKADIGFDERLKAVVSSARAGWHGTVDGRPLRVWVNATYWDTFAVAKGHVADPDGGTLNFEVEQGPKYPKTYGVGFQYSPRKWFDLAVDTGTDGHGGWYVAIVPVIRF